MADIDTQIAVIQNDLSYVKKTVDQMNRKLEEKYVTQEEFDPIRKLTYGLVALILTTVVGAVLSIAINIPR